MKKEDLEVGKKVIYLPSKPSLRAVAEVISTLHNKNGTIDFSVQFDGSKTETKYHHNNYSSFYSYLVLFEPHA